MNKWNFATKNIGIDLGTTKILVTVTGKGIVLDEPLIVAVNKFTKEVLSIGDKAETIYNNDPQNIDLVKPMKDGVIADYQTISAILKNIIGKVCRDNNIRKPKIVIAVPQNISELEERTVAEVILQSGAREVFLVDSPVCALIGAGFKIEEPDGKMIVDIGAGLTEACIVSLNNIISKKSSTVAGNLLDQNIIDRIKKVEDLSISSFTAERLKREIGSAETLVIEKALEVEGRDINTGLLKIVRIPSRQIEKAIKDSVGEIVEVIKNTFTDAPPEICSDIIKNGIYLTGGGAQLQNLDNLIAQKLNIKTYIVKRPEKSTIFGIKKIIENEEKYYDVMHIRR